MRYRKYLRERYRILASYVGLILAVVGGTLLVPLLVIAFYPDEVVYADSILLSAVPLIVIGLMIWRLLKPQTVANLTLQEGAVIILFAWTVAVLAATPPLMGISGLTFSQALFESTSGWTTTGLTVMDVENTPRIVLFLRSVIHFAGGAGFAIIALSAIEGSFSTGLVGAEGRTDQLVPHIRRSANIVLIMYSVYVVFGVVAFKVAGMGWFDAVNHAFAALSTGGFSTRTASIGHWDSVAIESVAIILMLLGTTNFVIAYAFIRGKFRAVLRSGEIRLMTVLIVVSVLLLVVFVTTALYQNAEDSLRVAIFSVVSATSTTGFSTTSFNDWPPFGGLILIVLMLIGGGTGSTAGGMKYLRVYILYKALVWEVRKAFMPRHALNEPAIWQGERRELLKDRQVRQTTVFIAAYLVVFVIVSGILMAYGYPMQASLFEAASTFGTGLSMGIVSPQMPPLLMWVMSISMMLGRLEIFTVVIGTFKLLADAKTLIIRERA